MAPSPHRITHADVFELLGSWERDLPVQQMRVGDLRVWPLLRFAVASALKRAVADGSGSPPAARVMAATSGRFAALWELRKALSASARDLSHEVKRLEPVDALFLIHTACRQQLGDSYYDLYCDPLADLLAREGRTSVTLEGAPPPVEYRVPRHRASRFLQAREFALDARSLLRRRTARNPSRVELPGYERLAQDLDGLGLRAALPTNDKLRWQAMRLQVYSEYFESVFERTQPKLAMTVTYFSTPGMALNLAARRAGVVSLDLQHGVTQRHQAYDAWTSVPADGYELLPDVFWCWSQADAAVIDGWARGTRHRSLIGGQPWWCHLSDSSDPAVATMHARVERLRSASAATHIVLLSLQWDLGLTPLMREMIRAAPAGLAFWIRLHPNMSVVQRAELQRWVAQQATGLAWIDEPTDLPLPLLLRFADVHCTRHSTVVQEAAASGIASVVLEAVALDLYGPRLPPGMVEYHATAADAAAALDRLARQPRRPALVSLGTPAQLREALFGLLDSCRRGDD